MKLAEYNKATVAVGTAGLLAVQQFIPMSPAVRGWVSVGLAVLGAAAVWRVPNAAAPVPESVAALSRLRRPDPGDSEVTP